MNKWGFRIAPAGATPAFEVKLETAMDYNKFIDAYATRYCIHYDFQDY
jgi:hypothetical protein